MKNGIAHTTCLLGFSLCIITFATVVDGAETSLANAKDYWGILGGYGMSIPGWGLTEERVKTIDTVFRYSHVLDNDWGHSWYRGNHEFWIELPLSFVIEPDTSPILAANFLVSWVFTSSPTLQPYVMAGGGPVYTQADIPGMGSSVCGNYQAGGGLRIPLTDRITLNAELRYHHISNLGLKEPNVPLNSVKAFSGLTFVF
ncbi:MAG: acyloxyacyl hydrolase [Spartobacteria bacterium]|nr:acyloxyacyl hydrolase [Spartobacteria bacterium]